MPPTGLPFILAAAAAAVGSMFAWYAIPTVAPPAVSFDPHHAPHLLPQVLLLAAILAGGIGAFEVSLALRSQQRLGLGPAEIGLMFTECSLVMVVVQAMVDRSSIRGAGVGTS